MISGRTITTELPTNRSKWGIPSKKTWWFRLANYDCLIIYTIVYIIIIHKIHLEWICLVQFILCFDGVFHDCSMSRPSCTLPPRIEAVITVPILGPKKPIETHISGALGPAGGHAEQPWVPTTNICRNFLRLVKYVSNISNPKKIPNICSWYNLYIYIHTCIITNHKSHCVFFTTKFTRIYHKHMSMEPRLSFNSTGIISMWTVVDYHLIPWNSD